VAGGGYFRMVRLSLSQEAGAGGGLIRRNWTWRFSADPSMSGGPRDQSAGGYAGFDRCGFF
jgi:hypothetical protein